MNTHKDGHSLLSGRSQTGLPCFSRRQMCYCTLSSQPSFTPALKSEHEDLICKHAPLFNFFLRKCKVTCPIKNWHQIRVQWIKYFVWCIQLLLEQSITAYSINENWIWCPCCFPPTGVHSNETIENQQCYTGQWVVWNNKREQWDLVYRHRLY